MPDQRFQQITTFIQQYVTGDDLPSGVAEVLGAVDAAQGVTNNAAERLAAAVREGDAEAAKAASLEAAVQMVVPSDYIERVAAERIVEIFRDSDLWAVWRDRFNETAAAMSEAVKIGDRRKPAPVHGSKAARDAWSAVPRLLSEVNWTSLQLVEYMRRVEGVAGDSRLSEASRLPWLIRFQPHTARAATAIWDDQRASFNEKLQALVDINCVFEAPAEPSLPQPWDLGEVLTLRDGRQVDTLTASQSEIDQAWRELSGRGPMVHVI